MKQGQDLRRLVEQAQSPQRMGSGFVIGMPDGEGGQKQVPVEIATVVLLDNIFSQLVKLNELMGEMRAE